LSYTSHKVRAYADRQTNGIQPTKEHARDIHYTNSAFNNETIQNTLDSNNTRIIPSSHFNIQPFNQIHCSLFGLTRALAIASQYRGRIELCIRPSRRKTGGHGTTSHIRCPPNGMVRITTVLLCSNRNRPRCYSGRHGYE
jgi:hypothetical protein